MQFDIKSQREFRQFLQKETYEPFLRDLMNRLKAFNQDIMQINEQSHGEYDYISESTGELFEATLLITPEIVNELFKNTGIWNSEKFSNWIYNDAKINIIERLKKKKNKNSIIIFNIFPMRNPRFSNGIYAQFASDGWDIFINEICNEHHDFLNDKKFYLISYNHDDTFLFKQLFPETFYNEFIAFYDEKDVFPIRVKNLKIETA